MRADADCVELMTRWCEADRGARGIENRSAQEAMMDASSRAMSSRLTADGTETTIDEGRCLGTASQLLKAALKAETTSWKGHLNRPADMAGNAMLCTDDDAAAAKAFDTAENRM